MPGDLSERVEFVLGEHVVPFANRPGDRVVDRQEADVGPAGENGVNDGAVRLAAQGGEGDAPPACVCVEHEVRIRPFDTLEGGGQRQGRRVGGGGIGQVAHSLVHSKTSPARRRGHRRGNQSADFERFREYRCSTPSGTWLGTSVPSSEYGRATTAPDAVPFASRRKASDGRRAFGEVRVVEK
jgi:hypothetical protein